jgi:Mn2+/Fe2+ NRAMP family transporter
VERKFSEAPAFYWLYTALIVAGAAVVMVPGLPLIKIAVFSQVVNGAVLPFVLVFMILLINKKELMDEFVNKPLFNMIAWATTILMIGLTLVYVYGQVKG